MRLALVFLAQLLAAMPGMALGYCTEPWTEPWCLSDDSSFRNESDFENCRWEVEQFVDDVNDYVECLANEQDYNRIEIDDLLQEVEEMEDDKTEQIDRANDVIRRFNCGADSGSACW